MGSFPFAFTVGTMSKSSPDAAVPWSFHESWRVDATSYHPTVQSRIASCFGTARCPDAVARPSGIRGGVSRRTSGRTLSRSERGDQEAAERGPPPVAEAPASL
jgi:hypothetical protein